MNRLLTSTQAAKKVAAGFHYAVISLNPPDKLGGFHVGDVVSFHRTKESADKKAAGKRVKVVSLGKGFSIL